MNQDWERGLTLYVFVGRILLRRLPRKEALDPVVRVHIIRDRLRRFSRGAWADLYAEAEAERACLRR